LRYLFLQRMAHPTDLPFGLPVLRIASLRQVFASRKSKYMPGEKKESQPADSKGLARRKLITGAVRGLVAGAVAGKAIGSLGFPKTVTQVQIETSTTTSVSQPWLPSEWDQVADVVVGHGGAGAVTALSAQAAGANVLILEKTPSLASLAVPGSNISGGGGNTHINGGLVVVPQRRRKFTALAALFFWLAFAFMRYRSGPAMWKKKGLSALAVATALFGLLFTTLAGSIGAELFDRPVRADPGVPRPLDQPHPTDAAANRCRDNGSLANSRDCHSGVPQAFAKGLTAQPASHLKPSRAGSIRLIHMTRAFATN